jgi:hypothetical protein
MSKGQCWDSEITYLADKETKVPLIRAFVVSPRRAGAKDGLPVVRRSFFSILIFLSLAPDEPVSLRVLLG